MKIIYLIILIYIFNIYSIKSIPAFNVSKLKIASKTDQIMLVIAESYKSYRAKFFYYIKNGNIWNEILISDAHIGRDGLGLQSEDDVKSPIGAFKFNKYFGIEDNPGTHLPYIKLNDSLYWNCDSNSDRYNLMVNIETYTAFNKSISEHLIDETLAYKYAMNINYNENRIPKKGSAIFLHCYSQRPYTGGCVALPEQNMIKVFKKINKNAVIIIDVKQNIYNY